MRAWRDRLTPAAVGLPQGGTRRADGLRREEVAALAGISVDYVVRLEQGRVTTPSAQVVAALARALQLTHTERDHLYRLAHLEPPADGQISRHPSSTPPALRNFARDTFPVDDHTPRLAQWPVTSDAGDAVEAAVVSDLRRATGRFPGDRGLARLIRDLTAGNERFAQLWRAGAVGAHREDHKIVAHPEVGPIEVDCDVMRDGDEDLKVVILTAAPGTDDDTKMRLALVAGVAGPAH
ncbi:Helix-turn-helix domain-containing protein [Paractinoplanes atraurantiacus]|uniref:Helix-turn-helix domain-containing protein n=1 Tax=Paractinoplanes atraurantiacus TaxID=1036182 RepID=A0A285GKY9_9ACTN|nr:Helix-turn-helix domain-containing protein [Actinoplanes atraurantiacus]